ncbi:MAG: hypothetical protein ABR563_01850, partial [Pyrinomonadaceae bacterium]
MKAEWIGSSRRHAARARLSVAVCACAVFAVSVAAQAGWTGQRRGEAGKDLNAVFFATEKRGWIAGDGGLVFRTDDGGKSWA